MDGDKQAWDAFWRRVTGGGKSLKSDPRQLEYFKLLRAVVGSWQDKRTLELGCGRGTLSAYAVQYGACVELLDSSERALEIANANIRKAWAGRAKTYHRDATATGLPDKAYDVVFSVGLLEHFADPSAVMAESIRLARQVAWHLVIGKTSANQAWYRNDMAREWYERDGWQTDDGPQDHIFQVYRYS